MQNINNIIHNAFRFTIVPKCDRKKQTKTVFTELALKQIKYILRISWFGDIGYVAYSSQKINHTLKIGIINILKSELLYISDLTCTQNPTHIRVDCAVLALVSDLNNQSLITTVPKNQPLIVIVLNNQSLIITVPNKHLSLHMTHIFILK